MVIENVLVENIKAFADYPAQSGEQTFDLIRLKPTINQYMHNKVPGSIRNVQFKNVALTGEEKEGRYSIWIAGADLSHKVSHVRFENISWFDTILDENSKQVTIDKYASDIKFVNSIGK